MRVGTISQKSLEIIKFDHPSGIRAIYMSVYLRHQNWWILLKLSTLKLLAVSHLQKMQCKLMYRVYYIKVNNGCNERL